VPAEHFPALAEDEKLPVTLTQAALVWLTDLVKELKRRTGKPAGDENAFLSTH
jgi:hypothetical protein